MQVSGTDEASTIDKRTPHWSYEVHWPPLPKTDGASPWRVRLGVNVIDGRVECTSFEMWTPTGQEGRPVTATALRGVPLGTLMDWLPDAVKELAAQGDNAAALDGITVEPRAKGRPPLYDLDHWRKVAEVYRKAAGRRPTQAVADAFGVSQSTASGWVRRCRKLGVLGETDQRRAGERTTPKKKGTDR